MRQVWIVNKALYRSLRNQFIERTGGSRALYRTAVAIAAACLLMFQVIILRVGTGLASEVGTDRELAAYYAQLMTVTNFGIVSILTACFAVMLSGLTGVLGFALRAQPMRPAVVGLATDAPTLVAGTVVGLSSIPAFAYTLATGAGTGAAARGTAMMVVAAVAAAVLSVGVVRIFGFTASRLRGVPGELGEALALLVLVAANVACFYRVVLSPDGNALWRLTDRLARELIEGGPFFAGAVAVLSAVAALVWTPTLYLPRRADDLVRPSWFGMLLTRAGRSGVWEGLKRDRFLLELIQQVRNPNIGIALSFMVLGMAGMTFAHFAAGSNVPSGLDSAAVLFGLSVELIVIVSVASYGATYRFHWLPRVMESGSGSWVRVKWAATGALIATMLTAAAVVSILVFGGQGPDLGLLRFGIVMLAVGMWIGALVPIDSRRSPVILVSIAITTVVAILIEFVLAQAVPGWYSLGVAAVLPVLVFLFYRISVVKRERRQIA